MKLVFAVGVPSDFDKHQTYVFGKNNTLPWPHNKQDMANFRKETTGHIVVMGRNTFESLPFRLPYRVNAVICSNHGDGTAVKAKDGSLPDVMWSDPIPAYDNTEHKIAVIGGIGLIHDASFFADEAVVTYIYMDQSLDEIASDADTLITLDQTYLDEILEGMRITSSKDWCDNGKCVMSVEHYRI